MQIITGKQTRPQRVVVYGPEGIGKTTFASRFPNPVYIDTEGSTEQLDVARTPKPNSWTMLLQQVGELRKQGTFSTLVIDTVDWAERLCEQHICAAAGKTGIEDFGYGKGYIYAAEEFGKFLNMLNDMRDQGWNIVMLAHSTMRKFELPDEAGSFDRWEMKLSKKVGPLVKEWSDMLLFANYKTLVVEVDGKNKAQGGRRVMFAAHHPCWDAKNRHGLADESPFDFAQIAKHIPARSEVRIEAKGADPSSAAQVKAISEQVQKAVTATGTRPDPAVDHEALEREAIDNPAVTAPQPTGTRIPFDFPQGFPVKLMELMQSAGVTSQQIQQVVAKRGYYPVETPIDRYDEAFIDGVLVAAWPKVLDMIKAL
jgi:hypothetical protein